MSEAPTTQELYGEEAVNPSFSYFNAPITAVNPSTSTTLSEVADIIRTDTTLQELTDTCRTLEIKEYKKFKALKLPWVTFGGVFTKRSNSSLINASGFYSFDIDGIKDQGKAVEVRNLLADIKEPWLRQPFVFVSPGGLGVKMVCWINAPAPVDDGGYKTNLYQIDKFLKDYEPLQVHYSEGAELDKACKDISRACFLCHDPDVCVDIDFLPEEVEPFILNQPVKEVVAATAQADQYTSSSTVSDNVKPFDLFEQATKMIESGRKPIYFQQGSRNTYVNRLALVCSEKGLSEMDCMGYCVSNFEDGGGSDPFTKREIEKAVQSGYRAATAGALEESDREFRAARSTSQKLRGNYEGKNGTQPNGIKQSQPTAEQITSFTRGIDDLPPFPLDAFPDMVKDYAFALNEIHDSPSMIGTALLTALSAANGRSRKVSYSSDWIECGCLYTAMVGNSGTGKSPILKAVLMPFTIEDKKRIKEWKQTVTDWENSDDDSKDKSKPKPKNIVITNATREGLYKNLSYNQSCIFYKVDELANWMENMGRYSGGNDEATFLEFYDNVGQTIERGTSDLIYIPDPHIVITGGFQPSKLETMKEKHTDSGLVPRFLFCYCERETKAPLTDKEISPLLIQKWESLLTSIINDEREHVYRFSADARALLMSFDAEILAEQNGENSTIEMNNALNKMLSALMRMCVILQTLNDNLEGNLSAEISADTFGQALRIIDYFTATARKVAETTNSIDDSLKGKSPLDKAKILVSHGISNVKIGKKLKKSEGTIRIWRGKHNF